MAYDWGKELSGFQSPGFGVGMGLLQMAAERPAASPMRTGLLQTSLLGAQRQREMESYAKAQQDQARAKQAQEDAKLKRQQESLMQVSKLLQMGLPRDQTMVQAAQIPGGVDLVAKALGPGPKGPNSAIESYEYAKNQGYPGSLRDWVLEKARASATSVSVGAPSQGVSMRKPTADELAQAGMSPDTEGVVVDGKGKLVPAPVAKDFTEGQGKAQGYVSRMEGAEAELSRVLRENPSYDPSNRQDFFAAKVPLFGNELQSDEARAYRQAAVDWIRAKLRKESGAVIAQSEIATEYENYFPVPGDTARDRRQKERARKRSMNAIRNEAGRAYSPSVPDVGLGARSPPSTSGGENIIDFRELQK